MNHNPPTHINDTDIAIIGMACRFPGAADYAAFWRNLRDGVESVTFFSEKELLAAGVAPATLADGRYVRARPVLEEIEWFDAEFFGFNPREAEILDPQQRLLLECAWQALEDGGYDPLNYKGLIGIFAGAGMSAYLFHNLYPHRAAGGDWDDYQVLISNDKDFLPARISHKLNLKGPSVNVQTACSTALVALHLACQSLLSGDCDMALAGGVTITVPHRVGYLHRNQMIFSPDGHCRAFDADARGTLPGSGSGMVLLKPLADAFAAGDVIHAVVKGSAINNDGAHKIGFTAPSVEGQAQVIAEAIAMAGFEADCIGYVEAHGTGTELGDPIEVSALTRAFRHTTDQRGFCALGSVKTNIGHLDTAAGVAGLIKTVLALQYAQIPASLHFKNPNPKIDFEDSPFFVNGEQRPWPHTGSPRRAGVSAFGIGGSNAHVVLEEAPRRERAGSLRDRHLLPLSAKSGAALDSAAKRLAEFLGGHVDVSLADAAFTLQLGRTPWSHRRALVAENPVEARDALLDPDRHWNGRVGDRVPQLVLMFPGQGAQHVAMGRELYEREPRFRETLDRCADLLVPTLQWDLRTLLYPAAGSTPASEERLRDTAVAQPALFAVEYALARLLMSFGIQPKALVGHSIGEYVAACLAGVFSLEDGLKWVAERGRLMGLCPPGAMLAVTQAHTALLPRLQPPLSLAAVNSTRQCAVSGPEEPIATLQRTLEGEGIACRRLVTSHAFHSSLAEPAREPFARVMAGSTLSPPTIPYLSNLTGTWIKPEEATDPGYWAAHLREPIQFESGLATILREPGAVLLEVGPGRTCATFALRHQDKKPGHQVITAMRHPAESGSDIRHLLGAIGRLWTLGVEVDWPAFYGDEARQRIPLPTYPFQRRRFWIDPPATQEPSKLAAPEKPSLHPRPRLNTEYQAPRNALEEKLVSLWSGLLGIERIGNRDSFFELGGDSLLATQVLARIRETFSVDLTLADFFAHPSLGGLSKRIMKASAGAAPTLECVQTTQAGPKLRSMPAGSPLPLSFGQERLWFLERLTPGAATYNMPFLLEFDGILDISVLERGVSEILKRHRSLRTAFREEGERAVQRVLPNRPINLEFVDLRGFPQPRDLMRVLAESQAVLPFPLDQPPLFRLTLLQLRQQTYVLLACIHHIIADGWSIGVLVRELSENYGGLLLHGVTGQADLPLQFSDYAAWQRNWPRDSTWETQLSFWRAYLDGAPFEPFLHTDLPRPAVQTSSGRKNLFVVEAATTAALKRVSAGSDATLFMVLLSVFAALLNRYSDREDLLVGTPVANRNLRETEGLIGFFVNSLALRLDLGGDPAFATLVERIKQSSLAAFSHGEMPFEKLVEALQPRRDTRHSPLFQVMFVFQNAPVGDLELPGLRVRQLELPRTRARFDLSLFVRENVGELHAFFEYNTDLFHSVTMHRMARHYLNLLRHAAADTNRALSALGMLDSAERHLLLCSWNDSAGRRAGQGSIHHLVMNVAARCPDQIALEVLEPNGKRLSYGRLAARAAQFAGELRRRGVGPETVVGIVAEPEMATLVAMLAVLSAGGAFLPLDPDLPDERLRFVIQDSGALLILAEKPGRHALTEHPLFLSFDELSARPTKAPPTDGAATSPQQSAYLIYTSGSTGRPKGVRVCHESLVNSTMARFHFYRQPVDRFLLLSPLAFDSSMVGLFWTLCSPGTLVLPKREIRADAKRLSLAIDKRHVTHLLAIPSFYALLFEGPDRLVSLKTAIVAGESCPANLPRPPGAALFNEYGPTEATVWSSVSVVEAGENPVSIGRPVARTQIYLLGPGLRLKPPGVPGSLHIGGPNLARGYHGDPCGTSNAFIPNPFVTKPGGRLYVSGDLAKYQSDGRLQFLGRLDHQIKLRGFRIDPGEMEAVMNRHDQVRDSLVVLWKGRAAMERLIAYVRTVDGGGDADLEAALRADLRRGLPGYMVPADFVFLETWPRTPNGKVDRRALPQPGKRRVSAAETHPENPVQALILDIWRELLGREDIPLNADFFEMGGHSLLAVQAVSRISRALSLDLPLTTLFNASTVTALALELEALRRGGAGSSPPVIQPAPRTVALDGNAELPLSFAQQRIWFLAQLEGPNPVYNLPANLRLEGCLDVLALEGSLGEIIGRHESLRTRFTDTAGEARQIIHTVSNFTAPVVDCTHLSGGERGRLETELAAGEVARVFDLSRGPLLRLTLLRLDRYRHTALLTMHHIISDGWSIGVIVREAGLLYEAFRQKRGNPLSPPTLQYGDFAVWQRSWLSGENLDRLSAFWRRELEDAPAPQALEPDRPRAEVQTYRGQTARFHLKPDFVRDLVKLGRHRDITLFMTLFAAFQVLMRHRTGHDDVVVGTSVAHRNLPELEGMVGFFINQLALRTRMRGGQSFESLLHQVRKQVLDAFAHQDLPFDLLVKSLRLERDLSRSPLFLTKFVFQNAPVEKVQLPGLQIEPSDVARATTKFDLLLIVEDSAEGLRGTLDYNADLYERSTVQEFLADYQFLLKTVLKQPTHLLNQLDHRLHQNRQQRGKQQEAKFEAASLRKLKDLARKRQPV